MGDKAYLSFAVHEPHKGSDASRNGTLTAEEVEKMRGWMVGGGGLRGFVTVGCVAVGSSSGGSPQSPP